MTAVPSRLFHRSTCPSDGWNRKDVDNIYMFHRSTVFHHKNAGGWLKTKKEARPWAQ